MNIFLIAILLILIITVLLYNSLVTKKNEVDNINASVDTLLKKRYDLIPNLVNIAKEYMKYEKELLEKVTALRSKALNANDETQKLKLNKEISSALGSIMVAVENYPELKANENMLHLQQTLTEIEEQISAARRAYNQAVTDYNNALEMIPTNFIARYMNYKPKELFEIEKAQKENVDIKKLFNQ
jgi:LemA protein